MFISAGQTGNKKTGEKEIARSARTQAAELWGWVGDAMVTESF